MKTQGFWKEKSNKEYLILLGIIAVLSVLYISLCFNYNLGVDEAYSVRTFNKDWPELIKRTAGDTHPPLYYFVARTALLLFGETIPKFKLVPAAFGVLSLLLSAVYIRPRFGFRTAVGYCLFFFGIPYLTEYVIQIRMYSPVLFFVTWSALAAVEVFHKRDLKHWIILFIAALCACYTHNYGLLAAFVVYMELGVMIVLHPSVQEDKQNIKNGENECGNNDEKIQKVENNQTQTRKYNRFINRDTITWFISGVSLIVCFFPWMLILVHQMENMPEHFMAQPVSGPLILEVLTDLFASGAEYTTYMFWFLFLVAIICCKWNLVKRFFARKRQQKKDTQEKNEVLDNDTSALCMFGVFFFTLALGIMLSLLITPLLMTRYMVSCLGVFSIFMAYGLQKLPKITFCLPGKTTGEVHQTDNKTYKLDPMIFVVVFLIGTGLQSYATNYNTQYLQYKTNDTVAFFQENLSENDVVVYNEPNTRWVYECYFDNDQLIFLSDMDFSKEYNTIWFMDSCCEPWLSDDVLTQNGLTKTYVGAYGIEYNDFSLYKITK